MASVGVFAVWWRVGVCAYVVARVAGLAFTCCT